MKPLVSVHSKIVIHAAIMATASRNRAGKSVYVIKVGMAQTAVSTAQSINRKALPSSV
jgi:hypothetical protein